MSGIEFYDGAWKRVYGKDLKPGDVIHRIWGKPNYDIVQCLTAYTGRYENSPEWKGVRIAIFSNRAVGQTIFPGDVFEVYRKY